VSEKIEIESIESERALRGESGNIRREIELGRDGGGVRPKCRENAV